jgi:hypothetical protein
LRRLVGIVRSTTAPGWGKCFECSAWWLLTLARLTAADRGGTGRDVAVK